MTPPIEPTENDFEETPLTAFAADMQNRQTTELLDNMMNAFNKCADLCQEQQKYLATFGIEEDQKTLPLCFSREISQSLLAVENILYAYFEHSKLDPESVWDFILDNHDAETPSCWLQIRDRLIVARLPYMTLARRWKNGTSVAEKAFAALIYHNYDSFPHWNKWQAKFYHVFPEKTSSIPRDVDNYDYKKIIDLIAFALGASDNATHFSMSMETVFDDSNPPGVYIEITPKSSDSTTLPAWAKRGRGRPKGSTKAIKF